MRIKSPVELWKGRSGEKGFAVALFFTLVAAAGAIWFAASQNAEDADEAFLSEHAFYVNAANGAVARLSDDFERLAAQTAASPTVHPVLAAESGLLIRILRTPGVFDEGGASVHPSTDIMATQNPALISARNSPNSHDLLFARSPFTGEKAVLFTAVFEDATGKTFVLAAEADIAPFADALLPGNPERRDILLLVAWDGRVIAAGPEGSDIRNLIRWMEDTSPKGDESRPLYITIRDRIAGFSLNESKSGDFRLACSPVSGTDWMLCQIEFI